MKKPPTGTLSRGRVTVASWSALPNMNRPRVVDANNKAPARRGSIRAATPSSITLRSLSSAAASSRTWNWTVAPTGMGATICSARVALGGLEVVDEGSPRSGILRGHGDADLHTGQRQAALGLFEGRDHLLGAQGGGGSSQRLEQKTLGLGDRENRADRPARRTDQVSTSTCPPSITPTGSAVMDAPVQQEARGPGRRWSRGNPDDRKIRHEFCGVSGEIGRGERPRVGEHDGDDIVAATTGKPHDPVTVGSSHDFRWKERARRPASEQPTRTPRCPDRCPARRPAHRRPTFR